jgi:protocatechuate 3,4-dioxygenase beta subunit
MISQLAMDRRQMLSGLALGLGGLAVGACGSRAGAQGGLTCAATPTEIRGPFPADGTNGRPRPINVLTMRDVVRRDIRSSFAGLAGTAEGVPVELELSAVSGAGCSALAEFAIYLWQNDAAGDYSLYNLPEANYLRGLQPGGRGRPASFTTIVPGCYGGRYPHCHLEVFASAAAALQGAAPLLVSQLAFPEAECRSIYASDARYGQSLQNLERQPLGRDFVFDDAAASGQVIALRGDRAGGYRGTARIVLG